jgi:hypothetical protein
MQRSRQLNGNPFGTRGNALAIPFSFWMRQVGFPECPSCRLRRANARCVGVVRALVLLKARCASVVRWPVMRCARHAKCAFKWARFRSKLVVQVWSYPECGSDQGSLCQGGIVWVWSAHAGDNPSDDDRVAEHAAVADRFAREIVGF